MPRMIVCPCSDPNYCLVCCGSGTIPDRRAEADGDHQRALEAWHHLRNEDAVVVRAFYTTSLKMRDLLDVHFGWTGRK